MENLHIWGTGIDIIDVKRIINAAGRHPGFLGRIFTENEIKYCSSKKNPGSRYISLAQRFAAKEAVSKALGTGIGKNAGFREIEIINEAGGKPAVRLSGNAGLYASGLKVRRIEISLSGLKDYAVAFAVVLIKGDF
ncbi:MAG: holo-[acyl-carrier-protein] synthase [Actinobacteria bacterium]|nr:holo-[acyl-carrier-protein] synthase [Actinomycetota bacterium]